MSFPPFSIAQELVASHFAAAPRFPVLPSSRGPGPLFFGVGGEVGKISQRFKHDLAAVYGSLVSRERMSDGRDCANSMLAQPGAQRNSQEALQQTSQQTSQHSSQQSSSCRGFCSGLQNQIIENHEHGRQHADAGHGPPNFRRLVRDLAVTMHQHSAKPSAVGQSDSNGKKRESSVPLPLLSRGRTRREIYS